MGNLITGAIAMALIIVFLGSYAVVLNALPLWIIIGAILVMAVTDFVQSLRQPKGNGDSDSEAGLDA